MSRLEPCPLCDGGKGWSPHWACRVCADKGRVTAAKAAEARTQGWVWKAPR